MVLPNEAEDETMKAFEIMNELCAMALENSSWKPGEGTCDTLKAGDACREAGKVAVTMFGTPDVIRAAAAWGADMMIVHEPLYYNHPDNHSDEAQEVVKRALLEGTGMTVYRFHDHSHKARPDMITDGLVRAVFPELAAGDAYVSDPGHLTLTEPMTPRELARTFEQKLGIRRVRIVGAADEKCTHIALRPGDPGGVLEELATDWCEVVVVGEACEWHHYEYARDAAQLGRKKAVLVLGHVGSERDGMAYIASLLAARLPDVEFRYFDCGEVYTYAD